MSTFTRFTTASCRTGKKNVEVALSAAVYLRVVVQVPQVEASGEVHAGKQRRVCWRPHGIVDVITAILEGVEGAGALRSGRGGEPLSVRGPKLRGATIISQSSVSVVCQAPLQERGQSALHLSSAAFLNVHAQTDGSEHRASVMSQRALVLLPGE